MELTINSLKYADPDETVVEVDWGASIWETIIEPVEEVLDADGNVVTEAVEGEVYSAGVTGTQKLDRDGDSPDFIPYDDLTDDVVMQWLRDSLDEDLAIKAVAAADAIEAVEGVEAVEAADAVMGERAVTETVETGSYINLAGDTIVETSEQNVTEEVTETVVERQTGEDGITREVEIERTTQVPVMEAYEIEPAVEAVEGVEGVEAVDAVEEVVGVAGLTVLENKLEGYIEEQKNPQVENGLPW